MQQHTIILLGIAAYLTACSAIAQPFEIVLPADTSTLRESSLPGFAIAQQRCGICHSADYISFQPPGLSLAQWTAEMDKMQHSYGAPLDNDEIKLVGAYLAVTYGSAKASDPEVIALSEAVLQSADANTSKDGTATVDVQELIGANACLACHALDHRLVGPGFSEVAAKYRDEADAQARLASSIRQGGLGKWGQVAMPPMPGLSNEQLSTLAQYVLNQ